MSENIWIINEKNIRVIHDISWNDDEWKNTILKQP